MLGRYCSEQKADWFADRRISSVIKNIGITEYSPQSIEEAYKVQKMVVKKIGWNVGGWKLGGTNQITRDLFQCETAYYGPIEKKKIINAKIQDGFNWDLPGSIRGEAEVAFRLSSKIDTLRVLSSLEEVFDYVDAIAPSLECPYSTIPDIETAGLGSLIGDLCGSGYLILGTIIPILNNYFIDNDIIKVNQDNRDEEIGSTQNIIGSPVQSLYDFLNLTLKNEVKLQQGQWVATGGCTNCIKFDFCTPINVSFSNIGAFDIKIKGGQSKD